MSSPRLSTRIRTQFGRVVGCVAAVVVPVSVTLTGCMDNSPDLQAAFTERAGEPTGIKMPKMDSPELPKSAAPTHSPRGPRPPCSLDDVVIAACLPETTALSHAGIGRGLAATADGDVWLVVPGLAPTVVTHNRAPVRQFLASPTVEEDGQVYMLREDSTVARLTLMPGGHVDVRELSDFNEPGILSIFMDSDEGLQKLLIGDPGIDFKTFCHGNGATGLPQLGTAILDGVPMLVEWSAGYLTPVGGVDLDNSIGGCAIVGDSVIVAVPDVQRVVSIKIGSDNHPLDPHWVVEGSPEVLVDGDFGHITSVAGVVSGQGVEIWGATSNKSPERAIDPGTIPGGENDDRVIRLPAGAGGGGSPD
ncbi:glucose dehydrogenase [Corynebacterium sp. H78]|uniref:glucose dehydrogenase n=1 Tax=Corynebacterium sp. H78 TaxID=3133417 RepID=UPI0030AB4B34